MRPGLNPGYDHTESSRAVIILGCNNFTHTLKIWIKTVDHMKFNRL